MCRPSGNVRSTRYRGMCRLLRFAGRVSPTVRAGAARAHRANSPGWALALPILAGDPEANRLGARLAPRADAQLPQDRGDVVVDRLLGQEEALGYLCVAEPLRDERKH